MMRIIDERTGTVGHAVSTPEEALLALGADIEERLARGLCRLWYYVHPDDAAPGSDDEADDDRERRTVRSVAEQRPGVLGAALSPDDGERSARRRRGWSTRDVRFDAGCAVRRVQCRQRDGLAAHCRRVARRGGAR